VFIWNLIQLVIRFNCILVILLPYCDHRGEIRSSKYICFFFKTATNAYYTVDIYAVILTGTYTAVHMLENKECACSFITPCKN